MFALAFTWKAANAQLSIQSRCAHATYKVALVANKCRQSCACGTLGATLEASIDRLLHGLPHVLAQRFCKRQAADAREDFLWVCARISSIAQQMADTAVTAVEFEPTHPKIVELESTALDHSAKLS